MGRDPCREPRNIWKVLDAMGKNTTKSQCRLECLHNLSNPNALYRMLYAKPFHFINRKNIFRKIQLHRLVNKLEKTVNRLRNIFRLLPYKALHWQMFFLLFHYYNL